MNDFRAARTLSVGAESEPSEDVIAQVKAVRDWAGEKGQPLQAALKTVNLASKEAYDLRTELIKVFGRAVNLFENILTTGADTRYVAEQVDRYRGEADRLREIQGDSTELLPVAFVPDRPSRKWLVGAGIVTALVLAIGGFTWWLVKE